MITDKSPNPSEQQNESNNNFVSKSIAQTTERCWAECSNTVLRNAYYNRLAKDRPISPELNAALAERFPGYDPVAQVFRGYRSPASRRKANATEPDFSTKTDAALRQTYYRYKKNKMPIPTELNTEMAARFTNYNPETQKFIRSPRVRKSNPEPKPRRTRTIDWTTKNSTELYNAYYMRKYTNKLSINDGLNAELARRFPDIYDAQTRTFSMSPAKYKRTLNPHTQKTDAQTSTNKSDPDTPLVLSGNKIVVTIKQIDDTYNDVLLNGHRILQNHINTTVHTWADGTILGIHGIVTDNASLPREPLWLLYTTDGHQYKLPGPEKFRGYNLYVQKATELPNQLRIELPNSCIFWLEFEKLKNRAHKKYFEIQK